MKKIIVEITGRSGKSFELTLNDTAWFGMEGNWNSLPGYMPASSGYFSYNSSYSCVHLFNRERTISESIVYAVDGDSPAPTKIHGALDDFPSSPEAGKSGKGHLLDHGKAADSILRTPLGFVSADIVWKIKSVV